MKNDTSFNKSTNLVATEVSASYPSVPAKSLGANAKLDGGADQGNGIEDFGKSGKGQGNSGLNVSADIGITTSESK